MTFEYRSTVYSDVSKVFLNGNQIATICGDPKRHSIFQVVTHQKPGSEFWSGFPTYALAKSWVEENADKLVKNL